MSEKVWESVIGGVAGSLVGGLLALVVASLTWRKQKRQGELQRLEAALAELILRVQALYALPWVEGSAQTPPDQTPPDQARVRLLLLTGSEKLDGQLRWMSAGWRKRWRLLYDYAYERASEFDDKDMAQLVRELEQMPEQLVAALRCLKTPRRRHVKAVLRQLKDWLEHLERL